MFPRLFVVPLVILSLDAATLVAQESTGVAESRSCLPTFTDTEFAQFDPSIRQHIVGVRQRAERTPTAETVGELGILLHAYDQYDRAAACYNRARELAPSAFQWSYYLAIARADAGESDAAIAALRQALQLTPGDLPARLRLAELLLGRGDLGESRRIYDQLVREHPDSGLAQYGLGRTQAEQGEVAAAVESYRRAIDRVPQFGAAHYALALLYTKLGQRERSAEHLAAWRANRERRPRAQDPWLDAIEARRVGPQHHVTRGRALQGDGRHREAIDAFQRALTMNPDLVQAHVNLVAAYAAIRAFDQAEVHYRRALALEPDLAENHYNYGVLLLGVGRQSEAIESFRRAIASNAAYADAHNNLGYLLLRGGRSDEAVHHLRAALAASPAHRDAHFNLAQALQALGKGAEAIAHFLEAVKVEDENTPLYLYYLADAYARQGAAAEAVRHAMAARARAVSLGQASLVRTIDENLERFKPR